MRNFWNAIWGNARPQQSVVKQNSSVAQGVPPEADQPVQIVQLRPDQEQELAPVADPAFLADQEVEPERPSQMPPVFTADQADAPPRPRLDPVPLVSVLIGSFNRLDLLPLAIESVRKDLDGLDHEIIVIDGGSKDGTIDWLLSQEDIVTIVQNNRYKVGDEVHRRMSWGRFMNLGFKGAAGRYLLMISDDCYLKPGSTRAALARVKAAEEAGHRVGGVAYYFRNWPEDPQFYVQRTLGGNLMINHGIYTREALEAVGYAEEQSYVFYKCDTDLSLKIWSQGFSIIDSEESICEHFFESEEAVRVTNNATMDFDRYVMCKRWPNLIGKPEVKKMGKVLLKSAPEFSVDLKWRPIMDQRKGVRGPKVAVKANPAVADKKADGEGGARKKAAPRKRAARSKKTGSAHARKAVE